MDDGDKDLIFVALMVLMVILVILVITAYAMFINDAKTMSSERLCYQYCDNNRLTSVSTFSIEQRFECNANCAEIAKARIGAVNCTIHY